VRAIFKQSSCRGAIEQKRLKTTDTAWLAHTWFKLSESSPP